MADTTKVQAGMQNINQAFKERDVQAKAKELNIAYVSLIGVPLNPDLAKVITQEEAQAAQAVIFAKTGKKLRLALVNPENAAVKELIAKLQADGYEVQAHLCSDESLESGQSIYFSSTYKEQEEIENKVETEAIGNTEEELGNLEELRDRIEASNFEQALNYVQVGAYKAHATDIHFEPQEADVLVRFRIDGVLKAVFNLSHKIYSGILTEMKHLSRLKMNVNNVPQDGQYSFKINEGQINVRVSSLPTHYGETAVLRLLDPNKGFANFEELGFTGANLDYIKEAITLPHGMILITGPTGSGKTTTLYSMLQSIDTKAKKVITLEDPIEYNLASISQSQVDPDNGYDFASGLRAILRQDPDVILVGEIRDLETAETAAQASLTGHLVLSTLHTNSAVESLPRLVNMGVKSFILAPALDLIVAQRLVRRLCNDCKQEGEITEAERKHMDEVIAKIKEKGYEVPEATKLNHPQGCDICAHTGYIGQVTVAEVLRFTDGLRNLILDEKPMPEVYEYIEKEIKMLTMREDGVLKVLQGITTLDEIFRVTA